MEIIKVIIRLLILGAIFLVNYWIIMATESDYVFLAKVVAFSVFSIALNLAAKGTK